MVNIHQMKTRSNKGKDNDENNDNKDGDNSDDEYEEVDEYGNLKDFIDYDYEEPFNKNMFNDELDKLKKRKRKENRFQTPIKKSRSNLNLSNILINYMVHNANELKKNKDKKRNIIVNENTDDEEEEEEEETTDDSFSEINITSDSESDKLSYSSDNSDEIKYDNMMNMMMNIMN